MRTMRGLAALWLAAFCVAAYAQWFVGSIPVAGIARP